MYASKELRIGLLVTIALVVFFTGFYFLKGSAMLSDERTYYCYYHNVSGLVKSASVELNGLEVGHVTDMQLSADHKIKVSLSIDKRIQLNSHSVATISSSNILDGKIVKIELGADGELVKPGGTIPSVEENNLFANIGSRVEPAMDKITATVAALDTVIKNVNLLLTADNRKAISTTLASLSVTATNIERLSNSIASQSDALKNILKNTNSFTATLAHNGDSISSVVSHLNGISGQLSRAPLQKTVTDLQHTLHELDEVLAKVNDNKGSLGMLVNDKGLYTNMDGTLKNMQILLADLKEHPSRYINVSVFGKKK